MALLSWTDVKVISGFQLIWQNLSYSFNSARQLVSFVSLYFPTSKNKLVKQILVEPHFEGKIKKIDKRI
jgi:hypothetical protein